MEKNQTCKPMNRQRPESREYFQEPPRLGPCGLTPSCASAAISVSTGPHCRGYCDVGDWAIQEER
jgi:hypothetical protein